MNRIEINEELLFEVLGINDIVHVQKEGSCSIFISRANNPAYIINIHEFAFKCKEWAKSKEYIIHSSPTQKIEHTAIVQSFDFNKFYYGENQFYALTEVEAIIKACEWILSEGYLSENR